MEALIVHYGWIAILIGAAIEGEPFAIAGGVLAERHLVPLWLAMAAAFTGAFAIDQIWFHLARRARGHRWVRAVARRPAFARALKLVERHPIRFVLLSRLAYGVRAVAAVALGASNVSTRLFVPLNLAAALVWSCIFAALGYAAGPLFDSLSKHFGNDIGVVALLVSLIALTVVLRGPRSSEEPADGATSPSQATEPER